MNLGFVRLLIVQTEVDEWELGTTLNCKLGSELLFGGTGQCCALGACTVPYRGKQTGEWFVN